MNDSTYEDSDNEDSDSDNREAHIKSIEPGKWIALPGEEDDGTTTSWMAQIIAFKSKNVITVRYLRQINCASEVADAEAHYDEINNILKKSTNQCFVFYETRTYRKVFREGYVNLKDTPFVILTNNEVHIHATWDESFKSKNHLVSFSVTTNRLAQIKEILHAVLVSD